MAKTRGTPQSSNKAGLKSLGKKMDNSRHGFEAQPAARKKEGAFGAATPRQGKASALRRVK